VYGLPLELKDKGIWEERNLWMDAKDKVFYGWKIAWVAFLANFMAVGTGFYAINAFLEPLCVTNGWSRTAINLAPMLGTLFGFSSQLIYGSLVNRLGPRVLMSLGALVSGIAFFSLGQAKGLGWFYFFYSILYVGNGAYAGIVANTAVNNWFEKEKGKALGLATAGMSVSGVLFPFLFMLIIMKWDLKTAFLLGGLCVLFLSPIAWKVIRNWPEELGTWPDGERPKENKGLDYIAVDPSYSALSFDSIRLKELFSSGTFWRLGLSYSLMMSGAVGVMSQLKPRFVELGLGDISAMALTSLSALFGAVGKYLWGFLCDKGRPNRVVALMAFLNAMGLMLGAFARGHLGLCLFAAIFGFAMGGVMSTFPILTAHVYGRRNFASVIRFLYLILILDLVGYFIAGQSFDRTGSYTLGYGIFIIMDLLAGFMMFGLNDKHSEG